MGELKCSIQTPDPVYEVMNTDHKLAEFLFKKGGPYYLIRNNNKDPIKREVKGKDKIPSFLNSANSLVAMDSTHSPSLGRIGSLRSKSLQENNVTHIRFIGCINFMQFWNEQAASEINTGSEIPKIFNRLLERK